MFRQRVLTRQQLHNALPLVVSASFHIVFVVILSVWVVPVIRKAGLWLDVATAPRDEHQLEDVSVEIDSRISAPAPHANTLTSLPDMPAPEPFSHSLDDILPAEAPAAETEIVSEAGVLKRASSVEGAVDGITRAIRGSLQDGDLLVVWLFDASLSLVDDRERIATRLKSFFAEAAVEERGQGAGQLSNSVVSFGENMKERVRTTTSRSRVIQSIRDIPVDYSGTENVFTALARCVRTYHSQGNGLTLVVWTDESGDDVEQLEEVIELCRRKHVPVHVVGPSAVLGAAESFHAYTDPETKKMYLLSVTRGPDSALPERIRLGYWFRTAVPAGAETSDEFRLPVWYGGRDLAGINSGFSPFALTRLAVETGGSFTILDSPYDRSPFKLEVMKDYLPTYDSVANYLTRLERHRLRSAVRSAVEVTRGREKLEVPPLILFGRRSEEPPYDFKGVYLEPRHFARRLRAERRRLIRQASRTAELVEEALGHVSADGDLDKGLRTLYSQENSPRWRAWYDLTRGRLLAASVRLEEYRLVCERLGDSDTLKEKTNFIVLRASRSMRSGETFKRRAEEAERLLSRCIRDNKGTPWEYLAQRELDHPWGITVRQHSLERIGPLRAEQLPQLPRY